MKSKSLIIASILAISTTAFAASHAGAPMAGTEKAGKHADAGKPMTRSDVLAKASARFDRMDTNKDGVLTHEERKAEHDKMRAKHEERKAQHEQMRAAAKK